MRAGVRLVDQTGLATMTLVYVASSWRNQIHPEVVRSLRAHRHAVYDYRQGAGTRHDGDPLMADAADYAAALEQPAAVRAFKLDYAAMRAADTFVLVLPCGRSAHLELGWAVGAGKRTAILIDDPGTPELAWRMVDKLTTSLDDLLRWLAAPGDEVTRAFDGYAPEHLHELFQGRRHDTG